MPLFVPIDCGPIYPPHLIDQSKAALVVPACIFQGTLSKGFQPVQKSPTHVHDAQVPLSEQWLVQGDLFYRLEGVDSGDEEPEDAVVVDLPRILDRSLQSAGHGGGASAPLQVTQHRQTAGGWEKAEAQPKRGK